MVISFTKGPRFVALFKGTKTWSVTHWFMCIFSVAVGIAKKVHKNVKSLRFAKFKAAVTLSKTSNKAQSQSWSVTVT